MVATIRSILEANRADLYLQPIVTLPQRKVRYYEAFTRLRSEDGTLLLPADFLKAAESDRPDRDDRSPRAVARRTGCAPTAAKESRRRD